MPDRWSCVPAGSAHPGFRPSEEGIVRTWTGEATSIQFKSTGTDKNHRAYIAAMSIIYEN